MFSGIGHAQLWCTVYVIIFYHYLMALTVYYMFASFQNPLPWTQCDSQWSDCSHLSTLTTNSSEINANITNLNVTKQTKVSYAEDYFNNNVLHKSQSLAHIDYISWKLIACMAFSWTIVYFSVSKGLASLGKVSLKNK